MGEADDDETSWRGWDTWSNSSSESSGSEGWIDVDDDGNDHLDLSDSENVDGIINDDENAVDEREDVPDQLTKHNQPLIKRVDCSSSCHPGQFSIQHACPSDLGQHAGRFATAALQTYFSISACAYAGR